MRRHILKYIEKKSKVDLGELAILLGTDEITVANDLLNLQFDFMMVSYAKRRNIVWNFQHHFILQTEYCWIKIINRFRYARNDFI